MQSQEFLTAVLPSSGHYCAAELSTPRKQHAFVSTLDALEQQNDAFNAQSKNTYFALSSFAEAGSRTASNAQLLRSIFVDIDTGDGGKVYPSKKEAVAALHQFTQATGLATLGTPWLVDSGGGVHGYWPLTQDATVAEWAPVAEAFKRRAKELGFRIDMTVTADAARVLRPPGSTNWNYAPPRPVVLKHIGDIFSLKALSEKLGASALPAVVKPSTTLTLPGVRPTAKGTLTNTTLLLAQNSVTLFKNIMVKTLAGTGCGQIGHFVENAKDDGLEPLWRGILSIAQKCDDGEKAAAKISSLHPYPLERMQRKLAEIKGPYACTKFDSENPGICTGCSHWGKITNPLALGRETAADNAEKTYVLPEDAGAAPSRPAPHLVRPELPNGYFYGKNGGVYMQGKSLDDDAKGKDVLLVAYDFFMVDMLQEGAIYISRFAAVRDNSVIFVAIPNKAMGSKDEVIKHLAAQNIIAAYGSGNDKNLYDFVRRCVGEASTQNSALRVPPTLGWQPDGSFAISDKVIQTGGDGYTYVSDRLTNIINATATQGTLGEWQRVVNMLQDKGQHGIVAMGAVGFASPLVQWVGNGAPAMVFHVCGQGSGLGKSLALFLCASVWGNPEHYPVKPTTSERTMLQRAGLLGNLPLLVDEVTNKSRTSEMEWLPEFLFDFSQGGHKLKGSGATNSELANDLYWNSLSILTSNVPAMEQMMGVRETSSEGEVRRFLEWRVTQAIEWTDAERELVKALFKNYGHAGRKYAEWLVNNTKVAKEALQDTMSAWRTRLKAPDAERFWTAGSCATITGAILAGPGYADVCNIQVVPVFDFFEQRVLEAREIMLSNKRTAVDLINSYTREFHGQFVKIGAAQSGMAIFGDGRQVKADSARGRIAGRIEHGVTPGHVDYYIELAMLKRYCSARNWSFQELERELEATMPFTHVRKDLLAKTGGPEMRVSCLKISKQIGHADETPLF